MRWDFFNMPFFALKSTNKVTSDEAPNRSLMRHQNMETRPKVSYSVRGHVRAFTVSFRTWRACNTVWNWGILLSGENHENSLFFFHVFWRHNATYKVYFEHTNFPKLVIHCFWMLDSVCTKFGDVYHCAFRQFCFHVKIMKKSLFFTCFLTSQCDL